ncbi:MAG: hypothetical protein ABJR05_09745 [Balneola sp.]
MKLRKKILALLIIIFSCSIGASAQSNYSCPDNASNSKNDSYNSLETVLTSDDYESLRTTFGLTSLENSTIELLTGSSYNCYKLNDYKSANITNEPNVEYTYYKVSNNYFIVTWFTVNSTKYKNILVFDSQHKVIHSILL